MSEPTGRTIIGSVVFFDIVRYSEATDARQLTMKAQLNGAIAKGVESIAPSERVILDTGDGSAICFLGDPEDALFVATAVNDALRRDVADDGPKLRSGINLGPLKLVADLNGNTNVVGDGINVAQRVMSFADEGEILVSRSYYEVVARLREGNERLFHYMGSKRDKHVREHQLYAFGLRDIPCAAERPELPDQGAVPEPVPALSDAAPALGTLAPALIDAEERRLTAVIGPLAKVIVRQAAERATTLEGFEQALAAVITDPADRSAFLAAAPTIEAPAVVAPPAPASAAPATEHAQPGAAAAAPPIDDAELTLAQRRLARHIGPLAGVLVRQAAKQAAGRRDFYGRLAAHISDPAQRAVFLADVGGDD